MSFLKYLIALVTICLVVTSGNSGDGARGVPADFFFVMDARSTEIGTTQNVNIQINANGEGRYERYDTCGVIREGENNMVVYRADQVVNEGEFKLREDDLRWL